MKPTDSQKAAILKAVAEDNLEEGPKRRRSAHRAPRIIRQNPAATLIAAAAITASLIFFGSRILQRSDIAVPGIDQIAAAAVIQGAGFDVPASRPSIDYDALFGNGAIDIASLFGLEVKTIVIDPGHGGLDPGSTGPTGLTEKAVTMGVAQALERRLQRYERLQVALTRYEDRKVYLKQRVDRANQLKADLFISLHVNYLPQEPVNLVETYYFGPQSDDQAKRLAERENQDSDYPLSEFRPLINRITDNFKQQESFKLAHSIQNALYRNMRPHDDKLIDAGIKTAPFVVLLGTEMPSILAELTCISNREQEQRLATPEYQEQMAAYLEQGIVEYLIRRQSEQSLMTGADSNEQKEAQLSGSQG